MTVTYELDLDRFEAWSGAVETLDRIQREGKTGELESVLDELYPEGMSETELNDLLWFDSDTVYEWLGMKTDDELEEEEQDRLAELLDKAREAETFEDFCNCIGECDDCPLDSGLCDESSFRKWRDAQ